MFALQHYDGQGFKGFVVFSYKFLLFTKHSLWFRFHCEGRIVTTLFGLLFWDILFASIPGAFETSYQSAPLDIAEDTFYFSRKNLIDRRLQEIRDGMAPTFIERFDDQHRPTRTWCVGVRWDLFEKQELLEIAKVSSINSASCNSNTMDGVSVPWRRWSSNYLSTSMRGLC